MSTNEPTIGENGKCEDKDEIWCGWVPKLSHEMMIKTKDDDYKIFDKVKGDDLKKVFEDEPMLLSDKRSDILFNNKHKICFSGHDMTYCRCCKEKIWFVNVEIKGKNNEVLIKGTIDIHKNGLVRYKILSNKGEDSTIKPQVIHKIVRDCLHFHLHHSSDMPLPPVKIDKSLPPVKIDELCDEDLAKKEILKMFLNKFVEYKRKIGKVRLASAEEDLSRAMGEIIYANSALDKFHSTPKKEENKELENDYEGFERSFENFNESFKVLLQRVSNRRNRISQYIMMWLSFTIMIFAIISTLHPVLQLLQPYLQLLQLYLSLEGSIKLLLLIWFFGTLYLFAKANKLRWAQK